MAAKVVVLAGKLQVDLTADEREASTELEQEPLDMVDESLLDFALAPRVRRPEEVE